MLLRLSTPSLMMSSMELNSNPSSISFFDAFLARSKPGWVSLGNLRDFSMQVIKSYTYIYNMCLKESLWLTWGHCNWDIAQRPWLQNHRSEIWPRRTSVFLLQMDSRRQEYGLRPRPWNAPTPWRSFRMSLCTLCIHVYSILKCSMEPQTNSISIHREANTLKEA